MALKVKRALIKDLHADPANVRLHDENNLKRIMASLQASGQQTPIVIDKKNIVRKGNGTLEAAKRLGWHEIDVIVTNLEGVALTQYAIADNRTSDTSKWDEAALAATLRELENTVGDISATGFTNDELKKILDDLASKVLESSITDEDEADDNEDEDEESKDDEDNETVRTLTIAFTIAEFEHALSMINSIKARIGNIGLGQIILKALSSITEQKES